MGMGTPNSWLFASDNSRYSTRARLLFMGLSFAIGILTFLLYLAIWYLCNSSRRLQRGALFAPADDAEGAGEHGMSDDAIAALPTFAHDADGAAAALDCAVCLGQVEAGEKVRRLPKCAHCFHADCVDAWLRKYSTCPMCRAAVVVVVGPAAAAAAATKQAEATVAVVPVPVSSSAAAEAEALPPV